MKPQVVAEIFWYDLRLQKAYQRLSKSPKNFEAYGHFLACAHAAARYTDEERSALIGDRTDPFQVQSNTTTTEVTATEEIQAVAE